MPDSRKIRKMMDEAGITQAELSRRTGIERSNMSLIVNRDRNTTEKTLARLCKGLGCKAEDIMLDAK